MRPEDNDANQARCICPDGCPTYNDCMSGEEEKLFCSRGETACNPASQGCICERCPVWAHYDLSSLYFCLEGAAS